MQNKPQIRQNLKCVKQKLLNITHYTIATAAAQISYNTET